MLAISVAMEMLLQTRERGFRSSRPGFSAIIRCTAFLEVASQQNIQLVPAGITKTPFLSKTEQIWSR